MFHADCRPLGNDHVASPMSFVFVIGDPSKHEGRIGFLKLLFRGGLIGREGGYTRTHATVWLARFRRVNSLS